MYSSQKTMLRINPMGRKRNNCLANNPTAGLGEPNFSLLQSKHNESGEM